MFAGGVDVGLSSASRPWAATGRPRTVAPRNGTAPSGRAARTGAARAAQHGAHPDPGPHTGPAPLDGPPCGRRRCHRRREPAPALPGPQHGATPTPARTHTGPHPSADHLAAATATATTAGTARPVPALTRPQHGAGP